MGASRKSTLPYKHSEITYLKAAPHEVGLLLNFGPKPQLKRKAFENARKEWWIQKNHPRVSA